MQAGIPSTNNNHPPLFLNSRSSFFSKFDQARQVSKNSTFICYEEKEEERERGREEENP